MPTVVAFSGMPASGKTTLAARVASLIGFPHLDKDFILESLFISEGVSSQEQRSRLSRKADQLLLSQCRELSNVVISSWWHHPLSSSQSGTEVDWLKDLGMTLIEVHCTCAPEIALQRYTSRQRHPGHFDNLRDPHYLLTQFMEASMLGPLFPNLALTYNTETVLDENAVIQLAKAIEHRIDLTNAA